MGKKRDAYLAPETRQLKYIIYIANSAVHDLPVTDVVEYENSTLQGWIFTRQIHANLAIRVTALRVLLVTRCMSQTLGG